MYRRDKLSENQPSGSGAKKRKKYAYYDILSFLDSLTDTVTDDSLSEFNNSQMLPSPSTLEAPLPSTSATPHQSPIETPTPTTSATSHQSPIEPPTPSTSATPHQPSPASRRRVNKQPTEFEKKLLEYLKSNQLELEGEDLAFFQSLQPTLKKFTNFQKFMFRTKVLQIVMDMENTTTQIHYSQSNVSGSSPQSYYSSPQIITPNPYHMQTDIHVTPSYENIIVEHIEGNTFVTTNQIGMESNVPAVVGNITGIENENYTTAPADDTLK